MRRIKSYTIIEMLVVMLISALSIGITYTCYILVTKQYLSYKKNSDELAQVFLMDKLLTRDIAGSKKIERTSEGLQCYFQREIISYEFTDSYVLRHAAIVDTFHISIPEETSFKWFDKIENIPGNLVDEVSFAATYKEEKINFYYKKQYGADVLMTMEEVNK